MRCAWQAFIDLLPVRMRKKTDEIGCNDLQEIRLRLNSPPQLILSSGHATLDTNVSIEDLTFCLNIATKYSPWAAETISQCFVTAPGGHRIGLCGYAVIKNNSLTGIRNLTSICIRVARDFPGVSQGIQLKDQSILIVGQPGSGKTTFLRDLIRQNSDLTHKSVCVLDERQEVFPIYKDRFCFSVGSNTDIMSGCPKSTGIEFLLRTMSPQIIAVDEITAEKDCDALLRAGWCGVKLLATAHAGSREDLYRRPIYKSIIESKLFDSVIVMKMDKSWLMEKIDT